MNNLIWLASYPKSGNTWVRILLESILLNEGEAVDINNLKLAQPGSILRDEFNQFLGFDSSDLSLEESWHYKRLFFMQKSNSSKEDIFLKTHDSNLQLTDGTDLIPATATKMAIYIVRNPLDVIPSLASHFGVTLNTSIAKLNSTGFNASNDQELYYTTAVYTKIDTWSNHVASWLFDSAFPVHLIRYEDLHVQPLKTLSNLLESIGRPDCIKYISKAVANSDFSNLASFEKKNGFLETSVLSKQFFRKGKVNSWKEELNDKQVDTIISSHEEIMKKLKYL
ncbi:MAG: sulfotransferase domain-containing protein [Roseivirga sp.]